MSTVDSPETASPSTAAGTRFIAYDVTISNNRSSTITHLTLRNALPAGTGFVSAQPSTGTCAYDAGTVTCALDRLAGGAQVLVQVVLTAPTTTGTIVSRFNASFDERFNDGPEADPKQDTVETSEATDVASVAGFASSYVPADAAMQLSTDPSGRNVTSAADPQLGDVTVPSRSNDLTASLEETPGSFACPRGYVCRNGDWLRATVPGTFLDPLRFFLRWDKSLIARRQNVKNFTVFHAADLTSDPEKISSRCSSATPTLIELPCLWGVRKERDGGYSATLLTTHNGYMR